MNSMVKYGLIAAVIGGFYIFGGSGDGYYADNDIDLNAVLDVTVDTLYQFQEDIDNATAAQPDVEPPHPDDMFMDLTVALADAYNAKEPALHTQPMGVDPMQNASMIAYEDVNGNKQQDESEGSLFMIEIDGENSRIIATSRSGAINDHHFSGTGLMAGMLIGSLLSRQRNAGVSSKDLANKKPITARAAAKARSGSGSHSRGK